MTQLREQIQSTQKTNDTTIVTAANQAELSPIEAAIMDACNELHEARSHGDQECIDIFSDTLLTLLDRYDATDGEDHPNPAWARPNQRALAYSAMGRLDNAVAIELTALKYADTPRRKEISLGNIADRLIRLGDPSTAIEYFLEAHHQSPDSIPVLLTGAVALADAGFDEQSDQIFATLLQNPALLAPNSELRSYLNHDQRTRKAALESTSGARLIRALESLSTGGAS